MSHTERNRETDQRVEEREKSDRIRKGKKRKRMAKREKERKRENKRHTVPSYIPLVLHCLQEADELIKL